MVLGRGIHILSSSLFYTNKSKKFRVTEAVELIAGDYVDNLSKLIGIPMLL